MNSNVQSIERWRRSGGFTLTELVVVIVIILLITIMSIPVVLGSLRDRRLGEGTRQIQGVLAGARDRAIASGRPCGVRFLRDVQDPWECSRLVYVGTPEIFSVGRVDVSGLLVTPNGSFPNPHFEQVDPGKDNLVGSPNDADDIPRVTAGSYIRFNGIGPLFQIQAVDNSLSPAPARLVLGQAPGGTSGPHTYQIIAPPVPLAQDAVQNLPDGIVIDLRHAPIVPTNPLAANTGINVPRSRGLPYQVPPDGTGLRGLNGVYGDADDPSPQTWRSVEIMFGPDGSVVGDGATIPMIHIWLGERADKGPDPVASCGPDGLPGTADDIGPARPHTLVTLNTRSGAVQNFQNPASAGTPARTYNEIYLPAEQLIGVSQVP